MKYDFSANVAQSLQEKKKTLSFLSSLLLLTVLDEGCTSACVITETKAVLSLKPAQTEQRTERRLENFEELINVS